MKQTQSTTQTFGLIFGLTFLVYVLSPNITSFDSRWSVPIAESILREGNVNLDEYPALLKENKYYHIIRVGGHSYSYFPVGPSLVALPFVWVADRTIEPVLTALPPFKRLIQQRSPDSLVEFNTISLRQPVELFTASFLSALSVAMIFLLGLTMTKRRGIAIFSAVIFASGTSMWSVVSRGMWQHTPGILISAVVLNLFCRSKQTAWTSGLIGALLGLAYIIRPTYSIAIIFFFLYAVWQHRRQVWPLLGGLVVVLVPFVILNVSLYHAVVPPYYLPQRLSLGSQFPAALLGNLISPARGLFVFTPWLVFAIRGFVKQRNSQPKLRYVVGAIIVGHWMAISSLAYWWGGHTFGPRYMSDMLPYFMFLLIPVLPTIWQFRNKRPPAPAVLFLLLVAWSWFIHFKGATDWNVYLWNTQPDNVDDHPARIWSLKDLQFFR